MKNNINDPGPRISEADLANAENALGFSLPKELRKLYIENNGGRPERYVYIDEKTETSVSEILQIADLDGSSAVDSYRHIVIEKSLAPTWLFPFAVDSGGDYFMVDIRCERGSVFFMDSSSGTIDIRDTGQDLGSFIDSLSGEE